MLLLVSSLFPCARYDQRPEPTSADPGHAYALAVDVPFADLHIPLDSRPNHAAPSELVPVLSTWNLVRSEGQINTYETQLPVRPRALFFFHPPEGMEVLDGKRVL